MCPLTLSQHRHGTLIGALDRSAPPLGRSSHFTLYALSTAGDDDPDDIVVVHDFGPDQIDNNIGAYVADELLPLLARARAEAPPPTNGYAYSEQETFERYVGAIVRSVDGNERRAWHRFYDNTLAALRGPGRHADLAGSGDFIGSFRAIYMRTAELVAEVRGESVLDVGSCFGFLPLFLAGGAGAVGHAPRRTVGCDHNPALVALANDYRRHRRIAGIEFMGADILAEPARSALTAEGGRFDVVTAIHLLEHLSGEDVARAMQHLWALTARRLIVAVPFEAVADPRFGHRQVFDAGRLRALAEPTDGTALTFEHHGGWLVLDRKPNKEKEERCNDEQL